MNNYIHECDLVGQISAEDNSAGDRLIDLFEDLRCSVNCSTKYAGFNQTRISTDGTAGSYFTEADIRELAPLAKRMGEQFLRLAELLESFKDKTELVCFDEESGKHFFSTEAQA